MAKKVKTVGYKPISNPPYLLKLSVGHLRKALEGLPDEMLVGPEYIGHVPDEWPWLSLNSFGLDTDSKGHQRFCFGVEGQKGTIVLVEISGRFVPFALEDAEAAALVEKAAKRERARYDKYHTSKPWKKSDGRK